MMHYLYHTFAHIVFWFIGGAFDNNHIPDATIAPEQESIPSSTYRASSATNKHYEINEENDELSSQRDNCVKREEGNRTEESMSQETSRNEIDNNEGNLNSNTIKNNKTEEYEYATCDTSSNENGDINAFDNIFDGSYTVHFAEYDEMMRNNDTTFSTDDGESIQGYDSILESPPLPQPKNEHFGFELSNLADFVDLEPTSNLDLSNTAGSMPGLCAYCFKREDQAEDKFAKKDKVSFMWLMFSKTLLFGRSKPLRVQCSACGFRMPEKAMRGRSTQRVKRFLRKATVRE